MRILEIMEKAGIFMIITETFMQCVPDTSYKKYIRVLIQFMLAGMIAGPILLFFTGISRGEWEERINELYYLFEDISESAEQLKLPEDSLLLDNVHGLLEEVERENETEGESD